MKTYANSMLKGFFCLSLIVAIHHLPTMAQNADGGSTKLIIIKERIDAEGNKTVERIEKEGKEAEDFDMENWNSQQGNPDIFWKRFDLGSEDSPLDGFDFDGEMPDFQQFFGGFFGEDGKMQGFGGMRPFGMEADKPRLGIQIQSQETQEGVLVMTVQAGSVAEEVGIEIGDIILAVDGESVSEPDELAQIIQSHEFGDEISLDILRDEKHLTYEVQLGAKKEKEIKTRKL